MMTLREAFPEVAAPKKEIILPPKKDDVLETVRAARELISDPNHWIQGTEHAKKKVEITYGVWIKRKKTVTVDAYCVMGALRAVAPSAEVMMEATNALTRFLPNGSIISMNDQNAHSHVIRQLDAFIASRERKAA